MKYRIVRVYDLFYVEGRGINKFLVNSWRRISPRGGFSSESGAWQWFVYEKNEAKRDFEVIREWDA